MRRWSLRRLFRQYGKACLKHAFVKVLYKIDFSILHKIRETELDKVSIYKIKSEKYNNDK